MPTTPNLELNLPTVGANRDTWGTLLNENFSTLDEFVQMAMPVGAIIDFAGPTPPPGWLACDGRAISRTTYSALFAVLGGYWGSGDGSTTFNLPPASGRASVGAGSVTDANGTVRTYSFAQRVGRVSYTLLQANVPNYTIYTDTVAAHSHGGATVGAGSHAHTTDAQGTHSHAGSTANGGDHFHTGYTSGDGAHAHNTWLPNLGTGAAAGGLGVLSDVFGSSWYPTDAQGVHTHNIQTYNSGPHAHVIVGDGNHAHNVYGVGDHAHAIYADGGHGHYAWSGGSGTAFDMVQPVMVVSKIIYAGAQAAPAAATAAVPLVRRLMSAPMRGTH